ncbi:helix-turn-helix transcriptional regulator [Paractinoplanes ferrugineus]|nr:LuxR family transcriptional regulator [Actinoplanes ferrugineus]
MVGEPATPFEPKLAEREAELLVIADSIAQGSVGTGGMTVVTGPAGFGRSALLRAASRMARDRGLQVLFASGDRADDSSTLLGTARRLITDRIGDVPHDDPAELAAMLARMSRLTPVAVIADDANLLDPACRRFLEELSRLAGSGAVLGVVAWRSSVLTGRAPSLSLRGPYRRVQLRPLSAGGVSELFRSRLPDDLYNSLIGQVYPSIGGNASLLAASLDDLVTAASAAQWQAGVGPEFSRAVQHLLYLHDSPELLEVAQGLAVLGDHCDPATLSRVLGFSVARLSELFDELIAIGLLAPGHFLRSRVQAAVQAAAEPAVVRRLNLRAAEVLHEDGASATVVARHLMANAEASQSWAPDVLCEAAEEALRERDFEAAAALLNVALDWSTAPDARGAIRARLLDVRWLSEPGRIGDLLASLAGNVRESGLAGEVPARLARMMAWQVRAEDARSLLALSGGDGTGPRERTEHAISDMWIRHVFPGTPAGAPVELAPEQVIGRSPWLLQAVTLPRLLAGGSPEQAAARAIEVLQRIVARASDLEAGQVAIFTMLALECFEQSQPWYESFVREAGSSDLPQWHLLLDAAQATAALWRGDFVQAETLAQQAIEAARGGPWSALVALPRAVRMMALTEQGRHEEVAAELTVELPEDFLRSPYGLLHLRARARHQLATGAPQSAADDLRAIGDILRSWGMEAPGLLPWRSELAEVALRQGDPETARRLTREHLALVPASSWSSSRAIRVLAETLPAAEGLPLLREAVTALQRHGESLEQARTLKVLARTYQRAGELAAGRDVQRRAEKLARRRGAEPAVAMAYSAPPARTERATKLSRAEAKVARLASQGYTNREISSMLFITMSTVEQHLTRIYRKLGIDRRDALDALTDSL